MASTYSPNKNLELPGNGDYVNSWNTPVNSDFTAIDTALGGNVTLNVTGLSGVQTLSVSQYRPLYLIVTGTLTANVTWQLPSSVGGQWTVSNGTTGAYTVTFASAGGGSSVTIAQGVRTIIVSDGTNVSLSVPAVSAAGSNTQVQYNSSGSFAGSANLTFDGTKLTANAVSANSVTVSGITANSVLVGNGSSAVTGLTAGTAGNVVIDNGTAWVSGFSFAASGFYQNLAITVASSTTVTVSASTVVMKATTGLCCAASINTTVSILSTGLNGLDTGTVAASTWYAVWAVSNGTTWGAVFSASGSAPNSAITATYPYYSRLGWVRVGSGSTLLATIQKGNRAQYVVGGTGVAALPLMDSGAKGNPSTPTWAAVATGSFVPTTASRIFVSLFSTSQAILAPNNSYGAYNNSSNAPPFSFTPSSNINFSFVTEMMLESSNVYWASLSASSSLNCFGWEDNI